MADVRELIFDTYGLRVVLASTEPVPERAIPFNTAIVDKYRDGRVRIVPSDGAEIVVDPASVDTPSGYTQQQMYNFLRQGLATGPSVGTVTITAAPCTLTHEVVTNNTATIAAGALSVRIECTHASTPAEITTTPDVMVLNPGESRVFDLAYPATLPAFALDATGSEITYTELRP